MLAISVITLVTKSREAFHNGPRHNNKNDASLLEGGTLTRKNVFHGFLRFGGGRNQQPLVGLEFLNSMTLFVGAKVKIIFLFHNII